MTTPILGLEQPAQGVDNWHIPINANFGNIDSKLGQAYRNIWEEDGITYISNNAKYVTDHWERWDNLKGAWLIKIDENTKTEYYCNAGSGTITWNSDPIVWEDNKLKYIDSISFKTTVASPGTIVRKTDASEYYISVYETPTKIAEFEIPKGYLDFFTDENNEFTVEFDLKSDYYGYAVFCQIYVNEKIRGTLQSDYLASYITFSEDISRLYVEKFLNKINRYSKNSYIG